MVAPLTVADWPVAPVRTDRLVLRPPEARDRVAFLDLGSDPEVNRHLGGGRDRAELDAELPEVPADRPAQFVVEHDGELVGWIGLGRRDPARPGAGHPDLEISPDQQRQLFENIYPGYEAQVEAIANSPRVVRRYGPTDWQNLDPAIRDMLTDLRYRGDYTNRTRRLIQSYVVNNDLEGFTQVMSNRSLWRRVPADRFQRRVDFLQQAVQQPTPPVPPTLEPFIRR